MAQTRKIALYIEPPSHHFYNDRLFQLKEGLHYSSLGQCYSALRDYMSSSGIPTHTADFMPAKVGDVQNVYVTGGILKDYRELAQRPDTILSACLAIESPIIVPSFYKELNSAQHYFKRVYSCCDGRSLERFVGGSLACEPFRWPIAFEGVDETHWRRSERKFLVMINVNKLPRIKWQELYTERMRAVAFFAQTSEIDLYGIGWDVPTYVVGDSRIPNSARRMQRAVLQQWQKLRPDPLLESARSVYLGAVEDKFEALGQYDFSLCFENMIFNGWITEKIFDCFRVGAIPIYWGAPDVQEHIPSDCFIDMRDFEDYGELRHYLKSLAKADIRKYRESAKDFLESDRFRPFTKQAFIDLFRKIIEEDTGVKV